MELYLHFSMCLHDMVLNYIFKYRDNFIIIIIIIIIIIMVLQPFVGSWPFFSFFILHYQQDSLDGGAARRQGL
jgi:phosphatidylglycerophosphate synthase